MLHRHRLLTDQYYTNKKANVNRYFLDFIVIDGKLYIFKGVIMPSHTRAERAKNVRGKRAPAKKSTAKKSLSKKKPFGNLKKGALRADLREKFNVKLPAGTNIPKRLIDKAAKLPSTSAKNKLIKKRAVFAKNAAKFKKR